MSSNRRRSTANPPRRRLWSYRVLWSALLLTATSCGPGTDAADPPTPRVELPSESDVFDDLHWPATEGAFEYRVRAWAGDRLLFEERTAHAYLSSTPTFERTFAFFPAATLRVQPLDAAGDAVGSEIEVSVREARGSAP